ncbi:50S ribosomal protein L9 [Alicyclobacillus sp. SO9]|uniref:50S ribosomal protein L9 n=1 Tax=Alicyclobacillus sp. SO9 TaxID=2665646 RepID=UPI0018E8DA07|nr:50S ribosomal protein L9 [Alicyclobacillus sp. SO9]QQE78935.1 50S ribosomal protein L9 [Alicyclobacillus sp. SO9]
MKVILLTNVKGQGQEGDVVDVSPGYGRNYLLPRKLAVEATEAAMKELQDKKKEEQRLAAAEKRAAEELASKLETHRVAITTQAGEGGRLFGAVTTKHIADALEQQGFNVDKRKIQLSEHIKSLGTHKVQIKLHPEVTATVNVDVQEG